MVLSDYLTGDLGWLGLVGREGRDSPHSIQRVHTGGIDFSTWYRPITESSPIDQIILANQTNIGYTMYMRTLFNNYQNSEQYTNRYMLILIIAWLIALA